MATADGPTYPRLGAGLGESDGPEKLSPSAVNRIMMELLAYFGRAVFLLYPVYLTGYLGLSVSWVLLCMVMATWWKTNRQRKDARFGTAIDFVDNETHVVNQELRSALKMATWVLQQAWPFFGMYMEKLLKENIQPAIRVSSPALKMFTFTKVHFGHIPLRITGMKVYTHEVDHREVVLDLNISYDGDVDIDAETLQINWTGMTNLLDSPAFSSLSEGTIMDIIASLMVLPNRMCVPLIDQVKVDQMRFPLPRGVVRVHLLEARDLLAKDTFMMGLVKGKSDPYATLRVGNRHFKSKIVKENLNPKWNEVYEFVVHEAPGQELEVEIYDEDTDKDDLLGAYNLDLGDVKRDIEMDQSTDGLACAMLSVYLDNASNLPKDHHEIAENQKHGKSSKEARILSVERPPPKIILKPPPEDKQHGPQTNQGGNAPASTPSANTSSSPALSSNTGPAAHALSAPRLADIQNGSDEAWQSPSSLSHMRRYDSHSLLSENSIASSRFDLSEGASFPEVIRNHQGSFGEIQLTVRYASLRNKLIVLVNSCRNIFRFSDNGTDSYVRLYLLPDQSWIHRKRTHVKKRTIDPVFDQKFEFDVSLHEAQTRKLDVALKNGKMFHSRDRKDIGMVMVDLSQLDVVKGVTDCRDLREQL
ncbi:Extended synaptotagmin-3 [Liparis tanakae]|uniref:Extended synaptotagmin-3 n=1 Tax=Liparis tanakae TaxID=230148 RepID=A0A4Z2INI4_9TELE|nr:Extended synaptotagmin-3 [Liparis tanakae]